METVDEQYKEGFNIGYWLARGNEQEQKDILSHLIGKQNPELSYAKGLMAGKKQMEKEKFLEQLNTQNKINEIDRQK